MPALTTSGLNDFIAEIAKDNLTRYVESRYEGIRRIL